MPLVDTPDTELIRKAELNWRYVRLYDPVKNGKTPVDGSGAPASSVVQLSEKESALAKGFTVDPVGWGDEWPTLGIEVNNDAEPATAAIVKGKADRERVIKK